MKSGIVLAHETSCTSPVFLRNFSRSGLSAKTSVENSSSHGMIALNARIGVCSKSRAPAMPPMPETIIPARKRGVGRMTSLAEATDAAGLTDPHRGRIGRVGRDRRHAEEHERWETR